MECEWCDVPRELVAKCQHIVTALQLYGIPKPELCPLIDVGVCAIYLNWNRKGVFCTLMSDEFHFTRVHPSGRLSLATEFCCPVQDMEDVNKTFWLQSLCTKVAAHWSQ